MQTIKILNGHELSDIVDEEKLFEAADINGISITDALVPGVVITVPTPAKKNLQKEALIQPGAQQITARSLAGQTWVDLALQQLGDEERLFELCDLNNAGITDQLAAGTVVIATAYEVDKKTTVYALKANKPASSESLTASGGEVVEEGIEFWAIEFDFVVS